MFDTLTDRLGQVFEGLTRRGALKENDVEIALREVRVALLEADVALPVVKDFIATVKDRAIGQDVLKSVTPGQMVVKVVHDTLVEVLGGEADSILIPAEPPGAILMVGLQGSGKTTTTAKLALRLQQRENQKVLMASLDVARPAAQEQLKFSANRPAWRRCRSSRDRAGRNRQARHAGRAARRLRRGDAGHRRPSACG